MKTNKFHIIIGLVLGSFLFSCNGIEINRTTTYQVSGIWKAMANKTINLTLIKPRKGDMGALLGDSKKQIGTTLVKEDGAFQIEYAVVDANGWTNDSTASAYLELGNGPRVIILDPNKNITDIDR